jgi:hypothetical protein
VQLPGRDLVTSKQAKQEKENKTMKKAEQRAINKKVEYAIERYNATTKSGDLEKLCRLRTCQATVYGSDFYLVLQSYNTVVAIIDKGDMTLYDFSRYVYGYTATTAKHIAKFANDYGVLPSDKYIWKEVK